MHETWVQSLSWEDPLEKEMATHSSILAWKIPWTKEPGRLQSLGSQRVGHDWATSLHFISLHLYCMSPPVHPYGTAYSSFSIMSSLTFRLLYRLLTLCMIPSCCCFCCQQVCQTLHYPIDCSMLGFPLTISWSLPKFLSIISVIPSNHFILSPTSLSALNLSLYQGLFQLSWLFASGGQSIGDSA